MFGVFETKRKFRLKSVLTSQTWLKPALKTLGQARCVLWDLVHGVDTCGEIPLVDLDFESEHKTLGLEYQSHHPAIIRDGLMSLKIQYQDYSFVDFGCGKGRVLLVAAEFPFRRITGLEFAPQLAETARRNLQTYRAKNQKCFEIEAITADATRYLLPHEPQVLYFYSPFERSVMDQVVRNIEDSLQKSPRDLLVLFSGVLGMRDSAFGSRPQYERLQRGRYIDVYRHRSSRW
jgi:SAM-dependent methyltransferase